MCDLENCDPNDLSRPSVSPTDRRLFLAGALALPLATIIAIVFPEKLDSSIRILLND